MTKTKIVTGERVGKLAALRPGCSAVIFDDTGKKILLTRRSDNGQWCLPGGGMDPGESAEEACIREVYEETGLRVAVVRLIGIYTSPNFRIDYPDGNKVQGVALNFEVRVAAGQPRTSEETTGFGYFSQEEMAKMDVVTNHLQRIEDAFHPQEAAFIR